MTIQRWDEDSWGDDHFMSKAEDGRWCEYDDVKPHLDRLAESIALLTQATHDVSKAYCDEISRLRDELEIALADWQFVVDESAKERAPILCRETGLTEYGETAFVRECAWGCALEETIDELPHGIPEGENDKGWPDGTPESVTKGERNV